MSGLDELLINLESLSGGIADAVERQIKIELKRIQADARRLAPVDTGQLRNSIVTSAQRDVTGDIIGTVGTALEYAPYVEFGTGIAGQNSEKILPENMNPTYRQSGWVYKDPKTGRFIYTEGQPAKPFLYPAYKQNEGAVRENIKTAARNALKRSGRDD